LGTDGLFNRRRFLQSAFAFSAATAFAGCGDEFIYTGKPDPVTGGVSHILMVGDWGTDDASGSPADQAQVAAGMQAYATQYNLSTDALFMLGDNFYGDMTGGVKSSRWQTQFEQLYPISVFEGPAYAVPGNHDYQNAPQSKFQTELAYAQTRESRWTMPARYYSFTFPEEDPTVTFIALDSNMPNEPANPPPLDGSYYTPTDADRMEQLAWLQTTLQQPLTTPFLVVLGHHPVYSNGEHGDNGTLIRDWDPLFRQYGVHLYLAGHDHDMQHLEFTGHPTSFFMSGGGGARLDPLLEPSSTRGPFAQVVHGFSHLQVRQDLMILRHLDPLGNLIHKFTKTPDGTVTIIL
jgi:tartrate-resistant acid phosphatase type 5